MAICNTKKENFWDKDNKSELAKMGKNGYEFLINHFSRKELSKKMINYIEAIL